MHRLALPCFALALVLTTTPPIQAQGPATVVPQLKSTKGAIEPTPLNARPLAKLTIDPKTLEGVDVFTADAKPLGKVSEVKLKEGRIAMIEVQAGGFLGYFATTYEIPAE